VINCRYYLTQFAVGVNYKLELSEFLEKLTAIRKPPKKSIEDKTKWMYNKDVKENGASHGAWDDKNNPYQEKRD